MPTCATCTVTKVNERKLPELDSRTGLGLRVPADEHLLVQPNWHINAADAAKQQQQQQQQQQQGDGGGGEG